MAEFRSGEMNFRGKTFFLPLNWLWAHFMRKRIVSLTETNFVLCCAVVRTQSAVHMNRYKVHEDERM